MIILDRFRPFYLSFVILFSSSLGAEGLNSEASELSGFFPSQSNVANWVFSGMVANENGDFYNYFFQMRRQKNHFSVIVALFDAQNKSLILVDEQDAIIADPERYNWHVGRSFLRFNAINNSWIFGIKTQDKRGFNFKVDMLNQSEHNPVGQDLRTGIEYIVSQTGQLNGHIRTGDADTEQFVTAKNAWFQQVWLSHPLTNADEHHELKSVLCRFNDSSGFYSMNMLEPDVIRGAVAGWFDEHGETSAMSQFIRVKEAPTGAWHIRIASPNMHFILSDVVKQNTVIAGFISEKDKQGFCMLSANEMFSAAVS